MSALLHIDPALQLTTRGALSLLFVWAASHKLRDLAGFRSALANYQLLPPRLIGVCAPLLIGIEIGVAIGLWLPSWAAAAAVTAAGLLAVYAGAIGINLRRGRRDISCGCAGRAGDRPLSAGLVVRNGVLAIAALVSAFPSASRPITWIDGVTVIAGVTALALLYAAVDGLLAHLPRTAALVESRVEHA